MNILTAEEVTNFYLYGTPTTPTNLADESLIRPNNTQPLEISVDGNSFMQTGPGRFALPVLWDVVNEFFNLNSGLEAGTYTELQLRSMFGISNEDATKPLQQYNYDDGMDNYAERTYIWNSGKYEIDDSAVFVVDANGNRHIEHFAIKPLGPAGTSGTHGGVLDNFDFEGGGLAIIGNSILEPWVDPSGIGVTVNIEITNITNFRSYTIANYAADLQKYNNYFINTVSAGDRLLSEMHDLAVRLFNNGVTKFLDEGNKPILYGTEQADIITGTEPRFGFDINNPDHPLSQWIVNGITYIGGLDNDRLFGTVYNDKLFGGQDDDLLEGLSGSDFVDGGTGSDTLKGGLGNDTLVGGEGNDTYIYNSGDGFDALVDSDGLGQIQEDGITLGGGKQFGDNRVYQYTDANNKKHNYVFVTGNKDTGGDIVVDGTILIKGFQVGNLGLGMAAPDAEPALNLTPETGNDIYGDFDPLDTDPTQAGVQSGTDQWGNIKVDPNKPKPDQADSLNDTPGNDHIISGGGDDTIVALLGGNDLIEAGDGKDGVYSYTGNDVVKAGAGDDTVYGGEGDDILLGEADRDKLYGEDGKEVLIGGDDSDILSGGGDDDKLYGDTHVSVAVAIANGNSQTGSGLKGDWLAGGSGNDTLAGGKDNDVLSGGGGHDLLIGGTGDDDIMGDTDWIASTFEWSVSDVNGIREFYPADGETYPADPGNDVIYAGKGNDHVWAGKGNDIVFGEEGIDNISGNGGNDVILGGNGDDLLIGDGTEHVGETENGMGDDYLDGGDGDDALDGRAGDDYLDGGDGDDTLDGSAGDDILVGGIGNDTLYGGGGGDRMSGGLGDDIYYVESGAADVVVENADEGNDTINSSTSYQLADNVENLNLIYGANNGIGNALNNAITGNDNANELDGGLGHDTLVGGAGIDLLFGGTGNDYLDGGEGDDLSSANGNTLGNGSLDGGAGNDTLLGGGGNDGLKGGSDNDLLDGGSGDDLLSGNDGNDTLIGGAGADSFDGGDGDDTYQDLTAIDVLFDNKGNDTLVLQGATGLSTTQSLTLVNPTSLAVNFNNGETLTLQDVFLGTHYNLKFGNGSQIDLESLIGSTFTPALNLLLDNTGGSLYGGAGNDLLYGGTNNDTLTGYNGDDTLTGGAGNDYLDGGEGNDSLGAAEGNDTLIGGLGADTLSGGTGDDAYIVTSQDTINDGSGNNTILIQEADGLALTNGVTDLGSSKIKLTLDNGGTLILTGVYYGEYTLKFGNGTSLDLASYIGTNLTSAKYLNANSIGGKLYGGAGNDILYGNVGNDILIGHNGRDDLRGSSGDDTLEGGAYSDTLYGGIGNDLLDGGTGNDWLDGGAGSDTYLFGLGWGRDTVEGVGILADKMDDVFLFGEGITPNNIQLHRNGTFLYISMGDAPLNEILYTSTTTGIDVIEVQSYFRSDGEGAGSIRFNDGTQWDLDTIKSKLNVVSNGDDLLQGYLSADLLNGQHGDDSIYGYGGNDSLYGGDGFDNLYGGSGDDLLDGGSGNDNLTGDEGSDTYLFNSGWGQDTLNNFSYFSHPEIDVIQFGSGILAGDIKVQAIDSDLLLSLVGTTDTIKINYYFSSHPDGTWKTQQIQFGDGTIWDQQTLEEKARVASSGNDWLWGTSQSDNLDGLAGNDNIHGVDGNDTLLGGAGDDQISSGTGNVILNGGPGNDTLDGGEASSVIYLFDLGGGQDVVFNTNNTSSTSILQFGMGIGISDLRINRSSIDSYDLTFSLIGTSDKITIANFFRLVSYDYDPLHPNGISYDEIDEVHFADGTSWDLATIRVKYLLGSSTDDLLTGFDTADLLNGGGGNDTLYGNEGDDILNGNFGNDFLIGEIGDDVLDGGEGNDTLVGGGGSDTIMLNLGWGQDELSTDPYTADTSSIDTIQFGAGISATDIKVERQLGIDSDSLILTFIGTTDTLTIWDYFFSEDPVYATLDEIRFFDGTVWDFTTVIDKVNNHSPLVSTALLDQVAPQGGSFSYTLASNAFTDPDVGDTLSYSATLADGSALSSWLSFNASTRTFSGSPTSLGTTSVLVTATDTGNLAVSDTFDINVIISDLTLNGTPNADTLIGGTGNDTLNGLAGNDSLNGNAGNDRMDGGAGNDSMKGGLGNDTYVVDISTDIITELANEGTDTVESGITFSLSTISNVENLTLSGIAAISATGNSLANVLTGNSAVNILDGGIGSDTMKGGTGNDIYVVDATMDVITESLNEGIDTVESNIAFDLTNIANVENLTLTGTGIINGIGNALDNVLTGNSANNTLDGLGGIDTLRGGAGNDTYVVDNSADVVTEVAASGTDTVNANVTYTLGSDIENLTLIGAAIINGTGNALANILNGSGNTAANVLTGGAGNDTYIISTGDTVVEVAAGGTDMVQSGITHTLAAEIENLTLTGTSAINGTGNALNNILNGSGNTAANVLTGGAGNDTYVIGTGDTVVELSTGGTDLIQSAVTYSLVDTDGAGANGGNIENLYLTGTAAINGTGNALNNAIYSNTGNNLLNGSTGTDTLSYIYGATAAVNINLSVTTAQATGGSGSDTITNFEHLVGSNYNDILTGSTVANSLNGGTGNDTINGGAGNDTLTGGTGIDFFVFDTALNSTTNKDTLVDFSVVDDTIRLENAILTKFTAAGALPAGTFVSGAGAKALDANDYLIYNTTTGTLSYDVDGNGVGAQVDIVTLTGIPALTTADFTII